MSELMWACAILPEKEETAIKGICNRLNKGVGLPETVFRFPLHISLKKSWQCDCFTEAQKDVADYFQRNGSFEIITESPTLHNGMIWLPVQVTPELQRIHDELDKLLYERYGVPIDRFDRTFLPHISLFTKGDRADMTQMYDLLKREIRPMTATITRVVVGGAIHLDTYYDL